MTTNKQWRSFLINNFGVAFEHLDLMLVSLLGSCIIDEFVGNSTPAIKLLYAYVGYAIAFFFRPLGAFCFGCIGDFYGRKISLISSMVVMSAATLTLSFIPGVQKWGWYATIIFLICRILQGFAVGGEYGTAMTYAFELNPKFRTFYGSCVVSSTHLGGFFASMLASRYIENFRMTFLIGGLSGFLLLLFRSFMNEYHVTTAKKISDIALESIQDKKAILEALFVASTLVLIFYGSLIYLNELIHLDLGIPRSQIFKANSYLLALWIILPLVFGFMVDKYSISYRTIMLLGAIGVFLSAPILGIALAYSSYLTILAAQILMHIFHMLFCLCTPRFFGDLFAGQARNTAVSTSYSLGASFTAALAPIICHVNVSLFHSKFAICIPFMLITLGAIFVLKKGGICKKRMIPLNYTT